MWEERSLAQSSAWHFGAELLLVVDEGFVVVGCLEAVFLGAVVGLDCALRVLGSHSTSSGDQSSCSALAV